MVDWISLSQTAGTSGTTTITITAATYSELTERTAALVVRAANRRANVTVQQAVDSRFMVSPTSFTNVNYATSQLYVTVTSDYPWTMTSSPSWCSLSPVSASSGQRITVVVSENIGTSRNGIITFTQSETGLRRQVSVSQNERVYETISISPSSWSIHSSGGSTEFIIRTDYSWTITVPSWATVSQSSGRGTTTVTVSAGPDTGDTRNGVVSVSTSTNSATASLSQEGGYVYPYLNTDVSAISAPSSGGMYRVYIESNAAWRADEELDWVMVSPSTGTSGNSVMAIMVDENETTTANTGTINFYLSGTTTLLNSISLSREGATADVIDAPEYFYLPSIGGSHVLSFTSTLNWSATTDSSWFTISPSSGTSADTEITITAGMNGDSERNGAIIITSPSSSAVTTVVQNASPAVDVDTPLTFYFSEAGILVVGARLEPSRVSYRINHEQSEWTYVEVASGSTKLINVSSGDTVEFVAGGDNNTTGGNLYFLSTAKHTVYGNAYRVLWTTAYTTTTLTRSMERMFYNDTGLVDTSSLLLPATTLSEPACYLSMFSGCINLKSGGELPFTTVSDSACYMMYQGCSSLEKTTSSLLPSSLEKDCYGYMYSYCSALTTAPQLHASSLAKGCYWGMFHYCTSLRVSPELNVADLSGARGCYQYMFDGCSSMNYITCLAEVGLGGDNFVEWVNGVSGSGTFVKSSSASWGTGTDGIPRGWSVVDA